MTKCIFCNLYLKKENIVEESKNSFLINDINPKSKKHFLFITKEHSKNLSSLPKNQIGSFFKELTDCINKRKLDNYKIEINEGEKAGQEIEHLHVHILVF